MNHKCLIEGKNYCFCDRAPTKGLGMFADKKVVVVMPAYNAAETLRRTYEEVMAQGEIGRASTTL